MKKYLITVKGVSYEVEVEEIKDGIAASKTESVQAKPVSPEIKAAAPKPQASAAKPQASSSDSANSVTSPMPGTILKVMVKAGDTVKNGDVLLVLEAMKMENEIMAPSDAVVASVAVAEGSTVSTGDVLVTFN
ncbi:MULTISPECIES: biotin/lipoyl-containing protein [unclassified Sedimentibacter]|uniref:biotin/lipoyl-containing protein n=1 Tax=unclassified Sedimentibacter TaxID=2649220 RepID=UPI0027E0401F|nr:biotin/lipoyl-containing protein [Sedimentibacter sp. MB35-C1]WMJ78561.1 biotin/lipoyl-containing protein [Sedimentibacter sp. MB35-C1]